MKGQRITGGASAAIAAFTIFTNGYSFLPGAFSGRDVWISHIIASVVSFLCLWLLVNLCDRYPGESFFGVITNSLGNFVGKIVAVILTILSILTLVVSLTVFSRFVQITALPQTPQIILPTLTVLCAALSCQTSLRAASGTARLLIWFFVSVFIFFLFGGIKEVRLSLLLHMPEKMGDILRGAAEVYLNRFATMFALISVYTRTEGEKRKKWFLTSSAISGVALSAISVITVATLGAESISRDFYPIFSAMSVKSVGGFIRHTEILACIVMTIALFFKSTVCILFSDDMLSGVSGNEKKIFAHIPIALFSAACTQIIYRDTSALRGLLRWKSGAAFVLALHIIIPIMLYAFARLRKKKHG